MLAHLKYCKKIAFNPTTIRFLEQDNDIKWYRDRDSGRGTQFYILDSLPGQQQEPGHIGECTICYADMQWQSRWTRRREEFTFLQAFQSPCSPLQSTCGPASASWGKRELGSTAWSSAIASSTLSPAFTPPSSNLLGAYSALPSLACSTSSSLHFSHLGTGWFQWLLLPSATSWSATLSLSRTMAGRRRWIGNANIKIGHRWWGNLNTGVETVDFYFIHCNL